MDALKFARISSASSVWDDSRGQAATSVFEHFEDEEEEGVVAVVADASPCITSTVVGGIVGVGVVVVVVVGTSTGTVGRIVPNPVGGGDAITGSSSVGKDVVGGGSVSTPSLTLSNREGGVTGASIAFTVIVDAGISVGFPGSRVKYFAVSVTSSSDEDTSPDAVPASSCFVTRYPEVHGTPSPRSHAEILDGDAVELNPPSMDFFNQHE